MVREKFYTIINDFKFSTSKLEFYFLAKIKWQGIDMPSHQKKFSERGKYMKQLCLIY